MKSSPHAPAKAGTATLLLLLVFVSGISAQTPESSASSSRSDKRSEKTNEQSYGTASRSERNKDASFAFRQNQSRGKQISRLKQSSVLVPLATARGSVPISRTADTLVSAKPSSSETQSTSEGIQKRWNEFGIWGGISFDSPTLIGKTPDARFGNIGLRYGRVLAASKTVAFEWTIDAVPLSILSNTRLVLASSGPGFTVFAPARKSVYGWGAAPIGLKFNFRRNRRVQPFGQATGGFLYFNSQVPIDGAARFNFTFDFSGGVQIVNSNRRSFTIGYKYQHISNANRATFNPGVDVQMIFAGFSVFK